MAYKLTWKGSPNYTGGRTSKISKIVIHWIVGDLAAADATFANPKSGVSAHYGVQDKVVHQYVKDADTAWHAMQANPYSIGIEHSAAPNRPASDTTIQTSAELVAKLCKDHKIPCDSKHIIKHSSVVATACPGTIPINEIIKKANDIIEGEMVTELQIIDLVRSALGKPATKEDLAKAGTMSYIAFRKGLYSSNAYKARVVQAGNGTLDAKGYMPDSVKEAYVYPSDFEEVTETLYRKK